MVEILSGATAAQSVAKTVPLPSLQAPISDSASVPKNASSDFYLSPVIRFDPEALAVIFELRDSRSGEVTKQFPPEHVVRELQKSAGLVQEPVEASEQTPGSGGDTDASAVGNSESSPNGGADQEVDVLI
ncbi:hypothetical protein [Nisaea nitritireducens]|uniref:hypothetical protein n=1 Tax=Nisaea nitritireducens TaxID=568392 RepID=UPI0018687D6E|nr:hypothetical protein [Nisaea nitritireducens]